MTEQQNKIHDEIMMRLRELSTPKEAVEVIFSLHFMMWMNYRDESTVDDMLTEYCEDFKRVYRNNFDA